MPGVHPRMASELRGPTVARQLEPPGFLALNYGVRTPISVLIAHVAFGAMLGGFYAPSGAASPARAVNDAVRLVCWRTDGKHGAVSRRTVRRSPRCERKVERRSRT